MIRGYAWGVAYPYLTRIGYGYALDMPRICFQPYLKNMDMYWLGYTYPTRMEHLCERETMGGTEGETRERERRRRRGHARAGGERLGGLDGGGMRTEELGAVEAALQGRQEACRRAVGRRGTS